MTIHYRVRILPPLPTECISKDDLHRLAQMGFHPQQGGREDRDKVIFVAPMYVLDETDRKYSFLDDKGTWDAGTEENSLYGVLVRIMKRAGLSYIYLTMIDKLIYKETIP